MKKVNIIILIITSVLLASCVPSSPSKKRKTASNNGASVDTSNDTSEDPSFNTGEDLYWYSGQKIEGSITLNEDTNTVVYLRGSLLHNFLAVSANFNQKYCLVTSFTDADNNGLNEHVRLRAVPISFNNLATGVNEKLLRIDVPEKTVNSTECDGVGPTYIDSNNVAGASILVGDIKYSLEDLCPNCSGIITASNVSLYTSNNLTLSVTDLVPKTSLDLDGIGLRIDVKNNSGSQTSSCTNSECNAKGFDCCSNGQCVNDGQEKPNGSSESDYNQALSDIGINPSNFVNYPNIFFICSSNQQVEPTPTPLPDAVATASAELAEDIADFNCLEGAKESPADYSACVAPAPSTETANETAFTQVRADVWARCGCQADPFPTEPDNPQCPDFGLTAVKDVNDNITDVICYTPPPIVDPTPFQNLSINLPVRSAPHRFFKENGDAVDDISTLNSVVPEVLQEGEEFSYLDEVGKTDPINGSFNINSILGQFKVDLSKAQPAKTINVELDQTYIISAVSGFATPCPQCANDAWFNNFSSHPQSIGGNGVQWTGYSTSRISYQNNITNGNYEDTIFGRACWLPPTMIPFSHKKDSNLQTQRMNRLATQAAYYVNGYQRDWFGFNKGALIGSFDGVRWFAIGNGRRVTSTSTKLFLAINAPFADLAEPTNILANIITDFGNNTAPNFDYDPNLPPDDPNQNQGATCQYFHQCNVDSDCVTKLGWEYTCEDTSRYKSRWPKFNSEAVETVDEEFASANFGTILQGNVPSGSQRRCVYRGAGAPCKQNYEAPTINALDRDMFTCAPNFYCSSLSSSDFNKEVVRTPNLVESILFGQEADYLGRSKSYLRGDSSLSSAIQGNMQYNALNITAEIGDWGVCRPGKRITPLLVDQHKSNDSGNRTDYISQISSCPSTATGITRTQSCPAFETLPDQTVEVGNYIRTTSDSIRAEQNMCGAESQKVIGTSSVSSFAQIEADTLVSVNNILNPTLAKDACLRRPGAVCHTNLDCSPNSFHAEQADFFGIDYFGNTEAEKKFWQEELICGQATTQPFLTSPDYLDYDMSKNRCCREVGKDFTMYTSGNTTIIPDLGVNNQNLDTTLFPQDGPAADNRYSRYAVSSPVESGAGLPDPAVNEKPLVQTGVVPNAYQWKTFNDTGKKTCCGGGWVRKFADGTTDWSNVNRLQMDVTKLSCLNYKNDLVFNKPDEVSDSNFSQDLNFVCRSPADGGCIQNEVPIASAFEITFPSDVGNLSSEVDTTPLVPPVPGQPCEQGMTVDSPYIPRYFENPTPVFLATDNCRNYFHNNIDKRGLSVTLPTYIGANQTNQTNIESVAVRYMDSSGNEIAVENATNIGGACNIFDNPVLNADLGSNSTLTDPGHGPALYCLQTISNRTILHIGVDDEPPGGGANWSYAGLIIRYKTLSSGDYRHFSGGPVCAGGLGAGGVTSCDNGMNPGNALYYLTKLSRLELLGVPQIFYEPLYCNSDRSKIVGGIFNATDELRTEFDAISFPYLTGPNGRTLEEMYTSDFQGANPATDDGSRNNAALDPSGLTQPLGRVTFQDQVNLPQIFSGNDFKCCIELGQVTSDSTKCCSNNSTVIDGERQCTLPRGTNLNVYFNKFISSEGIGTELPGGGLTEADFVPETGEPKLSIAVNNKLIALGSAFCANQSTRKGASFGYYFGEPNNGAYIQTNQSLDDSKRFSIIDSTNDQDAANDSGFAQFQQGYRWDHHFYCN
ncbi:MAG: hypothetical protein ACJAT2_000599 [Bacteriovoracaceae bacterium]|jgi:hypothetical protein